MSEDNESAICPHCKAKMVEYRFGFNTGLAAFLEKLYKAGREVRTNDLDLTYAQRTNSQKLAYWGLALPHVSEESRKKAGWWKITEKGKMFVDGDITIPKYAFTFRGDVVRHEGEEIRFNQYHDGYEYKEDYRKQVREQMKKIDPAKKQMQLL